MILALNLHSDLLKSESFSSSPLKAELKIYQCMFYDTCKADQKILQVNLKFSKKVSEYSRKFETSQKNVKISKKVLDFLESDILNFMFAVSITRFILRIIQLSQTNSTAIVEKRLAKRYVT